MAASKDNIKELALGLGMSVCGIAGADRFDECPPGRHPRDILPGCKSAIVIGVKLLDGVVQTNFRAFEDGRRDLKGIYGTYGYSIIPNFELTYACYAIAKYIEQNTDEFATPCSTGPMTNGMQISIRHAAVAAGLGLLGWSGLMMTPEFGARGRYGVILTTLELEQDPLYDGPPICDPEKCGICAKKCPTGALSKYGEEPNYQFTISGRKFEYCKINTNKCQLATLAMMKKHGGQDDYITTDDPTGEEIFEAVAKMPISPAGLQHQSAHNCGICLTYCPAANWGKRSSESGLSKGPSAIRK